jgi:hypothetical protein
MAKVDWRCRLADGVNDVGQPLKVLTRKPAHTAAAAAASRARVVHCAARANERGSAPAARARFRQNRKTERRRAAEVSRRASEEV